MFLGLYWNLDKNASIVQNDSVKSILSHRVPRSMPELASRLATMQYYHNYLPLMRRLAIPLYNIVKTGNFIWEKQHAEAYANLLYLMSLQVRNHIYDPAKPLLLMADTSALESSLVVFQWCAKSLALQIVHTKSILLTTSLRRQSPVHRDAYCIRGISTAKLS